MDLIVGMGEYIVTDNEDAVIRTFALASCVAVTVYSPLKKVAGMIHVVLPAPLYDRDGKNRPSYFAETGIPLLLDAMFRLYGCSKEELQVQMYGGAESMLSLDIYNIGKKNIDTVKKTLSEIGLVVQKTDLRGNDSRSISMEAKTGLVVVHRQPIINCVI
ncbi:chemotaxis protein CheD [Anaerotaenia torta]|uniref:chemotaxis protein CheD n=1 Tax=Anaerotaenia torta TaxID=433293 RepID=UPI003D1F227D